MLFNKTDHPELKEPMTVVDVGEEVVATSIDTAEVLEGKNIFRTHTQHFVLTFTVIQRSKQTMGGVQPKAVPHLLTNKLARQLPMPNKRRH